RLGQLASLAEMMLRRRFQHGRHVLQRLRRPRGQEQSARRGVLQPRVALDRYIKTEIAERAVERENSRRRGSLLLAERLRLHDSARQTIPEAHLLLSRAWFPTNYANTPAYLPRSRSGGVTPRPGCEPASRRVAGRVCSAIRRTFQVSPIPDRRVG